MTLSIPRPALVIALALAIAGAAGVGGYLMGAGSKNLAAARGQGYRSGFRKGVAAGTLTGAVDARRDYLPGAPGYQSIASVAFARGKRSGELIGQARGQSLGYQSGQDAPFEGYDGGWEIGRWYVIHIGSGSDVGSSSKYSIPERVGPMIYGQTYGLCDSGNGICS